MAWLRESVGLAPLLFYCLISLALLVRNRDRLTALHTVRFMLVPATELVYLIVPSMVPHAGFDPTSTTLSFAAF
jgi:hypothetical protein